MLYVPNFMALFTTNSPLTATIRHLHGQCQIPALSLQVSNAYQRIVRMSTSKYTLLAWGKQSHKIGPVSRHRFNKINTSTIFCKNNYEAFSSIMYQINLTRCPGFTYLASFLPRWSSLSLTLLLSSSRHFFRSNGTRLMRCMVSRRRPSLTSLSNLWSVWKLGDRLTWDKRRSTLK